jgi:hypothetical protein
MLHSIICGVDGSEASRSAARVAARPAGPSHGFAQPRHSTRDRTKEVSVSTRTHEAAGGQERRGRFSTGIEQLPDSPDKLRSGRFSNGVEQLPDTPSKLRARRFSEGIELALINISEPTRQ